MVSVQWSLLSQAAQAKTGVDLHLMANIQLGPLDWSWRALLLGWTVATASFWQT